MLPLLLKLFGYKDILAVALKIFVKIYHSNQAKIIESVVKAIPADYRETATTDELADLFNAVETLLGCDAMKEVMVKLQRVLS